MCDTLCAVKNATSDGSTIFAKNSDREPNEGHTLLYFPRQIHDPDKDIVKATYIEIPQVEETYAIILSAPYWLYGCEMGTNEYGVTIGNVSVYNKVGYQKIGLLGMDIIRLALERSKTANEALEVIINLLNQYGQGGNNSAEKKDFYDNSFIIADLNEAWVLETVGMYWIAEKIKDVRSISNTLTIGKKYDRIHPKLIDYAIEKGYCKSRNDFHFANAFAPNIIQDYRKWGSRGENRQKYTTELLQEKTGEIDTVTMMNILRDHKIRNLGKNKKWDLSKGSYNSICVHSKPLFVPTQSTAALVSHLLPEIQTHWVTGTSATCTSLFKPIFVEGGLPNIGTKPSNKYDKNSLWWRHELVHRTILADYSLYKIIKSDIENYEKKWIKNVTEVITKTGYVNPSDRKDKLKILSETAFKEALEIENTWIKKIEEQPVKKTTGGFFYRRYWNSQNKKANIPLEKNIS